MKIYIQLLKRDVNLHRHDLTKGFELSNVYWKPSIRSKRVPFTIVKARLEVAVKVIESLDAINLLEDNKDNVSLILTEIIQQLK